MSRNFLIVIYLCLLELINVLTQFYVPQSPCPNYFNYDMEGPEIFGRIMIKSPGHISMLTVKANFTMKHALTSNYVGRIVPIGEKKRVLQDVVDGNIINYRVYFATMNPVPRLTALFVNGNPICFGSPDVAGLGEIVTSITLDHVLFTNEAMQTNKPVFINQIPNNMNTDEQGNNGIYVINMDNDEQIPYDMTDEDNYMKPLRPVMNKTQTMQRPTSTMKPQTTPTTPLPEYKPPSFECGTRADGNTVVPLVYHGQETTKGDWPWIVAIYVRKGSGVVFICSGTLISDEHVVTAAHCLHQKNRLTSTRDIVVKLGVHNLQDWGDDTVSTRALKTADIHKSYNARTLENDIMIMVLNKPVTFTTYIRPACIWKGNPDLELIAGKNGVVIGWGNSELGIGGIGEPRQVTLPIVTTDQCRASKPDFFKLTSDTTLCAGDRNGSGPCNGDSGGGLYVLSQGRWRLRGVVSLSLRSETGDNSCNLNEYIVFTDVAKYGGWLTQYVTVT